MTVTWHIPDELQARLEEAATARGISVEALAVELLAEHATTPTAPPVGRRRLALAAIGGSGVGISHLIDELLAEGFGRD
jgi:hypothetical protein